MHPSFQLNHLRNHIALHLRKTPILNIPNMPTPMQARIIHIKFQNYLAFKLIIDKFSTLCNPNICDSDECPLSIKIFLNWTFDILCSSSNPVILMAVVLFISCLLYAKTSPLKVIFSKYISEK